MLRFWLLGLPALLLALGVAEAAPRQPLPDQRPRELRRFGAAGAPKVQAARVAATTVLTEHPSSLRLMKVQLRQLRALMGTRPTPSDLLQFLERPLMDSQKQLREFRRLALEQGVATAKMIDYEGKPMPPSVIPRYVQAIERAGMRAGIEGDRFLLLRLPGAAEQSPKDQALREGVFKSLVETNLSRLLAGRQLPLDRLIVPDTKSVDQLMEVHATYDRQAAEAVDRAVAARKLPAARRAEVLERLCKVQAVPLVEDASTVMNASTMVKDYLGRYRARYGERPKHLVLFVAGSDLNRELGPVGGQLARMVMRSRLEKLQRKLPEVDLIPWIGIGSGPMRSGVGRFPEQASMLHPGMTATVQPDQLDQRGRESTVAALGRAAFGVRPPVLAARQEARLARLGATFVEAHARISLENALSTVRIANLLAPLDQRGRKKSSAKLFYEKDGELYLRAVKPQEAGDGTTYGRTLDVSTYRECLPDRGCATEGRRLERAQAAIDRRWPKGLADPRAIAGAFARYLEAEGLTTVSGLGLALRQAERSGFKGELEGLRPMISFLVQNDGFVLTRDRDLVRRRIAALQPGLRPAQVERRVARYFQDRAALERYLGRPIESLVPRGERERYEAGSRKLYQNPQYLKYLRGGDLKIGEWLKVMDDLVPLLSHPSWNRIGWVAPPTSPASALA